MELLKLIKNLKDEPLINNILLVDRKKELEELSKIPFYYSGQIIGISGYRGIGKSTVFNLFETKGSSKIIIHLVQRETPYDILTDILFNLLNTSKKSPYIKFNREAEELWKQLKEEYKEYSIGISTIVSGGLKRGSRTKPLFLELSNKIKNLIKKMGNVKPLVIVLDEIDKETPEKIFIILDTIKSILKVDNVVTYVALPSEFYRMFAKSRETFTEVYNLENIFPYIIYIKPLPDGELRELINKRIKGYTNLFDEKIIELIITYSNGNPRIAIETLLECVFKASVVKREKVDVELVKSIIKPYLKIYVSEFNLTSKEIEILEVLAKKKAFPTSTFSQSDFAKLLEIEGVMSINQAYKYAKRLLEKGIIIETEEGYQIINKIKLWFEMINQ